MPTTATKKTPEPLSFKQKAVLYSEKILKFLFGLSVKLGQGHEVAKNNFNLGLHHLRQGNYADAIFRFKAVTWLEPGNVQAWYQLGTAYLGDNHVGMAASAYRKALSLRPDNDEVAYMLAIARGAKATPEELPKNMPFSLVHNHFERLAPSYNIEQVEHNRYKGHLLMAEAVRPLLVGGRIDHVVLDLGCGTGLCAEPLRSVAAHVTGVDISEGMLTQAMTLKSSGNKKIYDELILKEVREFLKEAHQEYYDIVLAGALFSFMGDVQEFFQRVVKVMRAGAFLVFTADSMEGTGYRFDAQAGRFRFSRAYLQEMATTYGLSELKLEEVEAYPGYKMWLAVFRK